MTRNLSSSDFLDLLTSEELAGLLKVPVATLYRWRYQGTGPTAIRVGRHLRYRRRDVIAWLDDQTGDRGVI